ncbi:MAG: ABC transporter permease [Desulfobacterota bacterium]|nr:ABC transporter permease [Thermodesulfobacteriota bacterium]
MRTFNKVRALLLCKILGTGIILVLLCAAAAPLLAPYDPVAVDLDCVKQPPSTRHLMGTDTLGRDILSRVLYAGRTSLAIGLSATVVSLGIGLCIGLISGYCGGALDAALSMTIDLFLAFPSLLLAIAVAVVLPPGIGATVFALCIAGWASFARLFRGVALSLKEEQFIDAARAVGCSSMRIIAVHVLPNCISIALVAASLKIGSFIFAEAALSFLGLGIQPPTPAWGSMISLYRGFLPSAPWMVIFPGCAIAGTVLLFNIFGEVLRDMIDNRMQW